MLHILKVEWLYLHVDGQSVQGEKPHWNVCMCFVLYRLIHTLRWEKKLCCTSS